MATKFRADRMEKLLRAVRETPKPKAFDMRMFAWTESWCQFAGQPDFCGTPACVVGQFAARRDLQRVLKIGGTTLDPQVIAADGSTSPERIFSTLQEYFGLAYGEVDALFGFDGRGGAETPKQAARYIQRFIARKQKAIAADTRGCGQETRA